MNPSIPLSSRIIASLPDQGLKPRLIVFAGVHGNEPSGVLALLRVFAQLRTHPFDLQGQFMGVLGNIEALRQDVRYLDEDLNRLFLTDRIEQAKTTRDQPTAEGRELLEITDLVESLESRTQSPLFFVDCHTTSSASAPFISLNEGFASSLRFAQGVPTAAVIGAEKEIKGCLSEWLNHRGWAGFTFEAGQHRDTLSIDHQEAIIWLALWRSGCLDKTPAKSRIDQARATLGRQGSQPQKIYQVLSAYRIREDEDFRMEPGYRNLQFVPQGELLATSNGQPVLAPEDAHLLMPLYQPQGNFGFFLVQEIPGSDPTS